MNARVFVTASAEIEQDRVRATTVPHILRTSEAFSFENSRPLFCNLSIHYTMKVVSSSKNRKHFKLG